MKNDRQFYEDQWDDEEEQTFQRLRKQTGKAIKNADRRQREKEFGRAISRWERERRRSGQSKP